MGSQPEESNKKLKYLLIRGVEEDIDQDKIEKL